MEGISLIFKVVWSPGEAMFQAAKNHKALAPIVLLTVCSLIFGIIRPHYVNDAEIGIKFMEQRGRQVTPEVRAQIIERANSTSSRVIGAVVAGIIPTLTILLITAVYFGIFTFVGRDGGFARPSSKGSCATA